MMQAFTNCLLVTFLEIWRFFRTPKQKQTLFFLICLVKLYIILSFVSGFKVINFSAQWHRQGQINAKFFIDISTDTINGTGGFLMYAKIPH